MSRFPSFVALLLMLALPGCLGDGGGSLLTQPDPVKQYYALQTKREALACSTDERRVLKVRRANIAPTYASRELVYRTGPNMYKTDYYNVFLVSPQDMISEAVLEWFAGSGMFTHVVPNSSALRPNYVLESSANRILGDFSAPGESKAVLEMQFFLLQDVLAQYKVVFCREYREEIALSDRTPENLVAGLEKALQSILEQLEKEMAQTLANIDDAAQTDEHQSTTISRRKNPCKQS